MQTLSRWIFWVCCLVALGGSTEARAVTVAKQFEQTSHYMRDTHFIDDLQGWAVGAPYWNQTTLQYESTVLRTVDGGVTWTTQPSGVDETLRGACFTDANSGWVVGTNGTILHTSNGGLSWTPQTVSTSDELRAVVFVSPLLGWATSIAETHWDAMSDPDGWAGSIWHTTDGGVTWVQQAVPAGTGILNRIDFVSATHGWAVGIEEIGTTPWGAPDYAGAVYQTTDGGQTWTSPQTPHTDNTPTEHGFVTLFPWSDDIGAVWLDGRNMAPDTGSGPRPAAGNEHGGMTLRFARFGYDGERLDDGEIDDLVCDCCQTDVAVTSAGPVVAYRNRTATEFRDIAVTRYVDGGWAEPVLVDDSQWHIPGCPVNGPAIAAAGKLVVLAWYGAPERQSRVKLAWSQDAGKTFSAPVIVDETNVTGRVDVVLLSGGSALVSWMGKSGEGIGQIRMREVTVEGERGPIQLIAEGRYSRNTGFPQMVRAGDRLVYAWPEPGKPRQVRTAFSPLGDG